MAKRPKEIEDQITKASKADQELIKFIEKERDDQTSALHGEIGALNQLLESRNQSIIERDKVIHDLNEKVKAQEKTIGELRSQIEDLIHESKNQAERTE